MTKKKTTDLDPLNVVERIQGSVLEASMLIEGLPCACVLVLDSFRCGYVGVPPGHPMHGRGAHVAARMLEVHNGVTTAGPILHIQDGSWYFGFDCNGPRDGRLDDDPGQFHFLTGPVRSRAFVLDQCERLAKQLNALARRKTKAARRAS